MITILLFHHYYCVERGWTWFHFDWRLVHRLTFHLFLASLSVRLPTRCMRHRISSRHFTFHHSITSHVHFKKETKTLLWLVLPPPTLQSCFWSFVGSLLYYLKVQGDGREPQLISRKLSILLGVYWRFASATSRRHGCSASPRCARHPLSATERKTSILFQKRAGSEDVSRVSASVDGRELPLCAPTFGSVPKAKSHRRGEK